MKEMREVIEEYLTNTANASNRQPIFKQNTQNQNKPVSTSKFDCGRKDTTKEQSIICFNCNETGHKSNTCPKPPKRPRCKDCQRVHPKGSPENCGKIDC